MRLRVDDVSCREIDDEMVLLDLRTSTYLTANRVGTTLLRLLAEECSTADLADALVAAFGIERAAALADTRAFLGDLHHRGLLERAEPGIAAGTPGRDSDP
ncbi:PqqD family peptide modification chaperone [Pseudactinotalea sp. HY160]|uniref:PqqD family protein n=1 Tax=Pseudactinotalea sp. HY160 TaxID=2654490 RepID=UPI00128B9A66|nr:PqqD family protein [Pseudactinotalea sp. HY160]MPV48523.1 PqqD family peptide modification chaperone [Pseudactinotalea sp. HY160]